MNRITSQQLNEHTGESGMSNKSLLALCAAFTCLLQAACDKPASQSSADTAKPAVAGSSDMQRRTSEYTSVQLAADTTSLTVKERQMLPLLIDAAKAMDPIYWEQTYGS